MKVVILAGGLGTRLSEETMDTLRDVRPLDSLWASGSTPWKIWQ